MKTKIVLFIFLFLFAGISFGQEPVKLDPNNVIVPNNTTPIEQGPRTVSISFLPRTLAVQVERSPMNNYNQSWEGVVADEYSSLQISITTKSDIQYCNFKIKNSQGGIFTQAKSDKSGSQELAEKIKLKEGKALVYYHPPNYIRDDKLLTQSKIIGPSDEVAYFMKVPIVFSSVDSNGNKYTKEIEINVYRTPIMFVHGFTGNKETWTVFKQKLNNKKYTAYADLYYKSDGSGYQSISAQSMHIGELISQKKQAYNNAGIKMQKVDLICHSMGGLFARNYAHNFPTYGDDVRKLIMVATPNHGIEWYNLKRNVFGIFAAGIQGQHKTLALEVRSSSPIIKAMNKGEDEGHHLNYEVQYGNIYVPTDDLVVSGSSAELNGVLSYPLSKNLKHSNLTAWLDLSSYNPFGMRWEDEVVTESDLVFNKIINWLTNHMPAPNYYKDKIDIIDGKGTINFGDVDANGDYILKQISGLPQRITSYTPVITGNDAREVTLVFTRDGKEWGQVYIAKNTELFFRNYSPSRVDVNISKGKAKFVSSNGKFNIIVTPFKDGKEFYNGTRDISFFPRAIIEDLDTEFAVEVDEQSVKVSSVKGRIILENGNDQQMKLINSKEAAKIDNYGNINSDLYNQSEIDKEFGSLKVTSNPLFANVTTGGTLVNPHKTKSQTATTKTQSCVGQLKVQFITPMGGSPANQQQQMLMQRINQQNQWELQWFNTAEANFKKGILPKELSGTFRPDQSGNPESGKYYSETVTLFKPMQIASVNGNAKGFSLGHGESQKGQHFSPIETAKGKILQCGSYKITVDPLANVPKTWATITFSEVGSTPPSNGNSGNIPSNPPVSDTPQSCIDQMTPQFLQKIGGASSDPQAQMIMRKLDNENKQEVYLFNKAKENFKNGIMPTQMNGTYRHQQNPSVFSRSYQCMTVTLFKPMKITGTSGNSKGFSLMREGQKYKSFNTNSEAIGTVLPCGSYKAYPNEVMGVSVIKLQLGKIE